jgi:hypothetical protein
MDRQQFLLTPEGGGATIWISNPPHISYKLAQSYEVKVERSGGVVPYFSHERLTHLDFYLCHAGALRDEGLNSRAGQRIR